MRAAGELQRPATPAPLPYIPPRPELDSESGLTRVGRPDASLLAIARGEARPRVRRLMWFCLGMVAGGAIVWSIACDVPASVYRGRLWAASTLRSLRGHGAEPASAPADPPSPTVASARPSEPADLVPTIDVSQLPRARAAAPSPTPAPPAPGAPALPHAPGPR